MEHIHLHVHFLSPVHACLHLSSDLSYALHHLPNASALAQACLKKSTHASAVTRVSRLVVNKKEEFVQAPMRAHIARENLEHYG